MFSSVITLICAAIIALTFAILNAIEGDPHLSALFLIQHINFIGCFSLLGIGIGVPLVMLASFFSWIQVVLLLRGNIPPHFAKEGFVRVLNTLTSKI